MPRNHQDIARDQKVAHILDLAQQRLLAGGLADLSVAALARELGWAQSAIYWYFPTKDDLVVAAIRRMVEEISRRKQAQGGDFIDRILWFVDHYQPVFELRQALRQRAAVSAVVAAYHQELTALIVRMLSGALREHVSAADLGAVIDGFRTAVVGAYVEGLSKAERRKLLRFVLRQLLSGGASGPAGAQR